MQVSFIDTFMKIPMTILSSQMKKKSIDLLCLIDEAYENQFNALGQRIPRLGLPPDFVLFFR